MTAPGPVTVALIDDYEVVLQGVKRMLDPYVERIVVADVAAGDSVETAVDIGLCDTFAQPESDTNQFTRALGNPLVARTVVYSWVVSAALIEAALRKGAAGYLSKTLPAEALVDALERIHRGEVVVDSLPQHTRIAGGHDWPGRAEGLSERESEIVAMITQGYSNRQVAQMSYLSMNTIKTYIRSAYRKMGVSSRSQAVLWGVDHGFVPPGQRPTG